MVNLYKHVAVAGIEYAVPAHGVGLAKSAESIASIQMQVTTQRLRTHSCSASLYGKRHGRKGAALTDTLRVISDSSSGFTVDEYM